MRGSNLRRGDAVRKLSERVGFGGEKIPGEALVAVRLGNLAIERAELRQRRGDDLTLGRGEVAKNQQPAAKSVWALAAKPQACASPAAMGSQAVGHG